MLAKIASLRADSQVVSMSGLRLIRNGSKATTTKRTIATVLKAEKPSCSGSIWRGATIFDTTSYAVSPIDANMIAAPTSAATRSALAPRPKMIAAMP
jgi:hypothetical protein